MKQAHPIAELFPLMTGAEFDALKNDIAENGLREAIWLHPDGSIIDGRNRYNACMELGVEPDYRTWNGEGSLITFVVSLNLHRRHLSSSQRAVLALDVAQELEKEAKEKERVRKTTFQKTEKSNIKPVNSTQQAAEVTGTNRQYVSDIKTIAAEAPEWIPKIREGKATITTANRAVKEKRREKRRKENAVKAKGTPDPLTVGARFATILLDPPWDWGDEGEGDGGGQFGRGKPDYATIPIDELKKLPIAELSDVDCHIYMWITNRSLPKGFVLLEGWGFRYITCLTWIKPNFGMGNYFRGQTEHILFGVKGSQALKRNDVGTVFQAERGPNGHSSKPSMIYDFIESCSPGPYLEMFSRQQHPGWSTWGADANNS